MPSPDVDLVDSLTALASGPRLGILRQLRTPAALRDIVVPGDRPDAGLTLARQTVRRHLERLVEAGVAKQLTTKGDEGDLQFVVDHQRLFLVAEEVRGLARLRPSVEAEARTVEFDARAGPAEAGPRLVLVRGLDEGAVYPLAPPHRTWRLGRRRGLEVSLDYDPTVSTENSLLEREGDHLVLSDVPGSRNGTSVNFRRLAAGERVRLRHGDLLSVGRSLLLYWE